MNATATLPPSSIVSNSDQNDSAMNNHIDSEDLEKTFKCKHPGCSSVFSKPSKLAIHIRQHTGERPYKCDHDGCDKSYTNSSHLKRHSKTHDLVQESFKCPKCALTISNEQNLKRHYKRIHNEDSPFSCKECGLNFSKELKYKEHEAMHKGIALYQCKICSRQYTTQRTFKKHQRLHDNEKEYRCTAPNCSEVFAKWSLLCKHKNSKHTNEYKCKDCEKVFLNRTQLKSHSFIHVDDRPVLPCPYEKCPRFYFFKRNLEHHVRTNHLGKKYHCDICDTRLSTKQKIVEHMSKLHLPKKKKNKKKKKRTLSDSEQRKRNDAGIAKKSMLSKLIGLDFPRSIEKEFLARPTRIQISQNDTAQDSDEIPQNGVEIKIINLTLNSECKKVPSNDIDDTSAAKINQNIIINESSHQSDERIVENCDNN